MGDIRVPIAPLLRAFGLSATVTRPAPDSTPITDVDVAWLRADPDEQPFGADFIRREPERVLVMARAKVPTIPRGTVIEAPEILGGDVATWTVEGFAGPQLEPDAWRVNVTKSGA